MKYIFEGIILRGKRRGEIVQGSYIENNIDAPCIVDINAEQWEVDPDSVKQIKPSIWENLYDPSISSRRLITEFGVLGKRDNDGHCTIMLASYNYKEGVYKDYNGFPISVVQEDCINSWDWFIPIPDPPKEV